MYDSADLFSVFLLGFIAGFVSLFFALVAIGRKVGR